MSRIKLPFLRMLPFARSKVMLSDDQKWFAVSLRFIGDGFNPTLLEAMLGLKPSSIRIKGALRLDKGGRRRGPAKTNLWVHRVPAPSDMPFDGQIQMLFNGLGDKKREVRQLASSTDVSAELFCGFGSGYGQGGDALSVDTLRLIVDTSLELSLDLYPPTIRGEGVPDDSTPDAH